MFSLESPYRAFVDKAGIEQITGIADHLLPHQDSATTIHKIARLNRLDLVANMLGYESIATLRDQTVNDGEGDSIYEFLCRNHHSARRQCSRFITSCERLISAEPGERNSYQSSQSVLEGLVARVELHFPAPDHWKHPLKTCALDEYNPDDCGLGVREVVEQIICGDMESAEAAIFSMKWGLTAIEEYEPVLVALIEHKKFNALEMIIELSGGALGGSVRERLVKAAISSNAHREFRMLIDVPLHDDAGHSLKPFVYSQTAIESCGRHGDTRILELLKIRGHINPEMPLEELTRCPYANYRAVRILNEISHRKDREKAVQNLLGRDGSAFVVLSILRSDESIQLSNADVDQAIQEANEPLDTLRQIAYVVAEYPEQVPASPKILLDKFNRSAFITMFEEHPREGLGKESIAILKKLLAWLTDERTRYAPLNVGNRNQILKGLSESELSSLDYVCSHIASHEADGNAYQGLLKDIAKTLENETKKGNTN